MTIVFDLYVERDRKRMKERGRGGDNKYLIGKENQKNPCLDDQSISRSLSFHEVTRNLRFERYRDSQESYSRLGEEIEN